MDTKHISEFEGGNFPAEHCFVDHNISVEQFNWDELLEETTFAEVGNICSIMPLGNDGFAIWDPVSPKIKGLLDYFKSFKPDLSCRGHLFLSTTEESKSFPMHKDSGRENFVLQLVGETPWRIANDRFTLAPGQMIFLPDGVPHYAKPNQRRASITVVFEDPKIVR